MNTATILFNIRILLLMVFMVSVCYSYARDYFVGGTGASDNNPGTAAQPFATIQKAASVAVAGDVVKIRSGTYRETIVVANSGSPGNPITFQPDQGATVVISGLNVMDNNGWTVHSGNIFKKTITLPVNGFNTSTTRIENNTTIYANQIFREGEMMFQARWPKINTFADLFDRNKFRQQSDIAVWEPGYLQDNGLPLPAPGLVGATLVSNGWFITEARTITSHTGNQLTHANIWNNTTHGKWSRKRYYLTGKLALLTTAKEWHYENGTLYFWQPGGGTPSGTIEYKARNWGFDIRGKANITIAGLTFKGCDPAVGNSSSANTVIDNIRASYMNHHVRHDVVEWQGVGMSKIFGIKLLGANSVIKNSELHSSGSAGVWLGPNCRAENNLMHDIGYVGYFAHPISLWGRDGGQVITRNTIYRTGRSCFDFGWNFNGQHLNVELSYNDFSQWGLVSGDLGATYAWGQCNLTGLNYHHNWIHDGASPTGPDMGVQVGIYFDQASGPGTVHHNVTWNCVDADAYHEVINPERQSNTIINFYNNTFATTGSAVSSYRTYVTTPHDVQRNNIYRLPIVVNWGASAGNVASSLLHTTNPLFVGAGGGGLNYRLQAGSPAINAGAVIPGITDGSVGAPDIGAYEYGGEAWVPGYKPVPFGNAATNTPPVGAITAPANNATFTEGTAITITATASDANGSVAKVEFFSGTTELGEDATSPYSFAWNNAAVGTHSLTVKVTDNQNSVGTSAPVSIAVSANTGPIVAITAPANNASIDAGVPITIAATASDANGSVTKVEFFNGTTKLGEDLTAPYSFAWNGATAGNHSLTAKATDNQNNVTTSTDIVITVVTTAKPVVSITGPANNAQFTIGAPITIAATAADANGSITKVEFFNGTTKLGEDATSPYSFIWGNAAVGNHSVTARATDNENNTTTSAAVAIRVSTNSPPVVLITAPLNNAQIMSGGAISITASASDANGAVAKVEFFSGTTKLGEDLTSPYGFIWSNAPAGDHALTAKATDNLGAIGTSAAINISVVNPVSPTVDAGEDQILTLPDNSLTLTPSVVSGSAVEYNWVQVEGPSTVSMSSPNSEQLSLTDLIEGTYIFELSVTDNNGLTSTDEIRITVIGPAEETASTIPRFFSPNDDGTGDLWEWQNTEMYDNSLLTIFNRAGQKIFEALSYKNTWDGKLDGQPLQAGDYYYVIRLTDLTDIRGAVRIIR
jgi:gliding motility-associated-like protein